MSNLREAAQAALEACADVVYGWESLAPLAVRRAAVESLDALRAALAEPEQITHRHDWFRTGGMAQGEFRCISCGAWGNEQKPHSPATTGDTPSPDQTVEGAHPDTGAPLPTTVRGWLHHVEMVKSQAWNEGYERGKARAGDTPSPVDLEPPVPLPLTDIRVRALCRECDLDWHRGWSTDGEQNRYLLLVRAAEAAHGIKEQSNEDG